MAALAATIVVVILVVHLVGGGSSSPTTTTTNTPASGQPAQGQPAQKPSSHTGVIATTDPTRLHVAVINSTQISGLAHELSGELVHNGYTQATFLEAQPSTQLATSTVMYAPGHLADARAVAQVLGIADVQAIDPTTRSISGNSSVVVIAGTDQANAAPSSSTTASGQ